MLLDEVMPQRDLLETYLEDILNTRHELVQMGKRIDCSAKYGDKTVKPRLYSLHEPEVVCIAKDKARTRYEFGSKVSVVTTAKEGFVLDCQALHGNPYDGHTVNIALKRVLLHTSTMPTHLPADRGYRGSESTFLSRIHITGKKRGRAEAVKGHAHNNAGRNRQRHVTDGEQAPVVWG